MRKILLLAFLIISLLGFSACTQNNTNSSTNQQTNIQATTPNSPTSGTTPDNVSYSLADISTHNTANNCWITIDNKVYDITAFVSIHPGGDKILKSCGIDATKIFNEIPKHLGKESILLKYFIGELK